jgi:hypothetical protein
VSRKRRLIAVASFLLFLAVLGEGAARLALALTGGGTSGLLALRLRKLGAATGKPPPAPGGDDAARQLTAGSSLHPFLGYVQTPMNANQAWLDLHHLPINAFGFIDNKPSLQHRSPQRLIVGVTGGSVAFFFGSEGAKQLRQRLAALPAFADRDIVVVRLALGGFKEPQQLATLSYLLALGGEFDVLINLDGFNEVALHPIEGAPVGAHPAYPRAWPFLVEADSSPDRLRALGAEAFWSERRARWATLLSGRIVDHFAVPALVWNAGDRVLSARLDAAQAAFRTIAERKQLSYSATGPHVEFASREEMFAALAALWEQSSLQLSRLCRANGIEYYHFLQPNQYVEGTKPMSAEERKVAVDAHPPYAPRVVAGYPLLKTAGARLVAAGVQFTDLTRVFAGVEAPLYRDTCCHLTAEGNVRLADAVADRIAAAHAARVAR